MRNYFAILFIASISMSLFANDHTTTSWESTYYVGSYGFTEITQTGISPTPRTFFKKESYFNPKDFATVQPGDIVRIMPHFASRFYHEVLPQLPSPVVLLISGGDESFPSDCNLEGVVEEFVNHKNLIHTFAQNCDYGGPSQRVSPYPIGLDFHSVAYKGKHGVWGEKGSPAKQEMQLKKILSKLQPTNHRKLRAFVDFQHSDTMHGEFNRYIQFGEDRTSIFKRLKQTELIDYGSSMRRSSLWKKKGQYAFSISPHGNGLDCHRTWEDLVLGCIVIVKTSPLDPLYEGLPVVIVKDWSEVTQENLLRWANTYGDAFTNPEYRKKLSNDYWLSKISSLSKSYQRDWKMDKRRNE